MAYPKWRASLWEALRVISISELGEHAPAAQVADRMQELGTHPEVRVRALAAALERSVPAAETSHTIAAELRAAVERYQTVQNAVDLLVKYTGVAL